MGSNKYIISGDLTGKTFGRLLVVNRAYTDSNRESFWLCECICGNKKHIRGSYLRSGHTQSCGCLQTQRTAELHFIHGGYGTPEYRIWQNMKSRCLNPNSTVYENYGGRGIKVCDEWLQDFPQFLQDMGKRPTTQHTIDRIDNEGNYEPSNCRWATPTQQAVNRRSNVRLTISIDGTVYTKCLKEWCDYFKASNKRVYQRISRGWSPLKALLKG